MQQVVTGGPRDPDKQLSFRQVGAGKPQLEITALIPDHVKKAYAAAETGADGQVSDLLGDIDMAGLTERLAQGHFNAQTLFLMGLSLSRVKAFPQAESCFKQLLKFAPHAMVCHELSRICMLDGRLDEAAGYRKLAFELDPNNPLVCSNYATDLFRLGQIQEGIKLLWEAANAAPNNERIASKYLSALGYLAEACQKNLREAHKQWVQQHATLDLPARRYCNDTSERRTLRVGYLLPDLRRRTLSYGLEAMLTAHDPQRVTLLAYTHLHVVDERSEQMRQRFARCRDISGLGDAEVAALIEGDQIDILLAVGGHSHLSRMRVLAYRPAPVQMEYGCPCQTPMPQINYRLEDWLIVDNSLQSDAHRPLQCYCPVSVYPHVSEAPAQGNGFVTFACFNNSYKITPSMLAVWARILRRVPESRLLLKFRGGYDTQFRKAFLDRLVELGVAAERIEIHGWQSHREHLDLLGQADIALDTYPNNGRTTSMEALWMGVPFVSRVDPACELPLSTIGKTLLNSVGLPDLACATDQEYFETATLLARRLDALAQIRRELRARMMAPQGLCDSRAFARRLEVAYGRIWRDARKTLMIES